MCFKIYFDKHIYNVNQAYLQNFIKNNSFTVACFIAYSFTFYSIVVI